MINRIKRFFYNIFYSIPFGMKGANDEMFSQKESSNSDNVGIHEVVQKESLGRDLLKGEVTQQVEELRYRTYTVERESNQYDYLGNGVAIRREKKINDTIDFSQENKLLCADILTELKRVDKDYGRDEYTLSVSYDDISRFRLEKYCFNFMVFDDNTITNNLKITLQFGKYPDSYDRSTYSFINEIKNMINGRRNEFSTLKEISFITYKALNEDDYIQYNLYDLLLCDVGETDDCYYITYTTSYFRRTDLAKKFYSETMDKKYKDMEKKDVTLDLSNTERVKYCSECGKKISAHDGDITEATYGYPLCKDCLKKTLDKN